MIDSYIGISDQELKGDFFTKAAVAGAVAPYHKVNAGVSVSLPHGLSATLLVNHVGEAKAATFGDPMIAKLDAYTLVNARLGYRFPVWGRELELSVQAFNLLNDVHRETIGGDLIERRVSGTVRLRF